ncbi:hypothetical protein, partial [Helicobacter pylori]|uniref:hypothetical protein n=1 Tax=Helicobacter pylori TaxID=210 RepID=UPI000F155CD9
NVKVTHPISEDYGNVFEYGMIYQNLSVFSGLDKGKNGYYKNQQEIELLNTAIKNLENTLYQIKTNKK